MCRLWLRKVFRLHFSRQADAAHQLGVRTELGRCAAGWRARDPGVRAIAAARAPARRRFAQYLAAVHAAGAAAGGDQSRAGARVPAAAAAGAGERGRARLAAARSGAAGRQRCGHWCAPSGQVASAQHGALLFVQVPRGAMRLMGLLERGARVNIAPCSGSHAKQ